MRMPFIRVLHVLSNFGIGGAETWLIALLRYFKEHAAELGCDVQTDVFLTHGFRDSLDEEAEALGARLIYARYSRKTLPSFAKAWRRALAVGNYDAIHDHQEFTAGWHFLLGVGHLPRVRIAHLHNSMKHQVSYGTGPARRAAIRLGNRLVARHATHLLSTSRQLITEQGFDNLVCARDLPMSVVYCGFDTSRFRVDSLTARQRVVAEFDLVREARIMLFVGRLDSNMDDSKNEKNPAFCLEVARECATRDPNFICLIAGGGDGMREILSARVKSWGLENRILLLGPRSDVPVLMAGADLLLFPSLSEGLGMVAVEAQAAGLPVLASDTVPAECRVIDGMVEFMALGAGAACWSERVLRKLAEPKPDPEVANGVVSASAFSIEHSAERLISIYSGHV